MPQHPPATRFVLQHNPFLSMYTAIRTPRNSPSSDLNTQVKDVAQTLMPHRPHLLKSRGQGRATAGADGRRQGASGLLGFKTSIDFGVLPCVGLPNLPAALRNLGSLVLLLPLLSRPFSTLPPFLPPSLSLRWSVFMLLSDHHESVSNVV